MKAVFVHDHAFPMYRSEYYESSGFDEKFINRYLDIFGNLNIIARHEIKNEQSVEKSKKIVKNGVYFCTFQSTKEALTAGYKKIKETISDCDFAVIRVPSVLGIAAVDVCRKMKKPYLIEVVGCAKDALAARGGLWVIAGSVFSYYTKRVVLNAPYVVYVTEKYLEMIYPTGGKWTFCSNVTLENYGEYDIEKRLKKIREKKEKDTMIIGTCASIDMPYKGQEDVIKALKKLRDRYPIRYELVGSGKNTRLKNIAQSCNVLDRIRFLGELPHEDIFQWLDTIDLYIQPSRAEGLCRAIIEAMSRGCPVIGSDAGGISEQIEDKFIYKKGNINQLVKIIESMDKEESERQALCNYQHAERYSSAVLYQKRKEFFRQCIEESVK